MLRVWRHESWSVEDVWTSRNPIYQIHWGILPISQTTCVIPFNHLWWNYMCYTSCGWAVVELVEDLNILDPVRWGQPARQPSSYSRSSLLAWMAADTDDGAGRSSFGIFSHPPTLNNVDSNNTQLEKQLDNCNCILIQWWRGWLVTWVLQITRLVSNVKYPATITLSRTEINTKHTYDCMHSAIWWSCMPLTRYQSIGFLW